MNRSNPFNEIEQFFGRTPFAGPGRNVRAPDVDVAEYDDEVVVVADLPGFDREDIDVRANDGRITIHAERDAEHEDGSKTDENEGGRYLRRERRHESVTRSVDIGTDVVESDASATYQNGVLTITLPKRITDGDDSHRIDVE